MYNHRWIYTDHCRDSIYRVRSYIWNCSLRTKSSYPYRSQSLDHRESSRRQYSARVSCPRREQSSNAKGTNRWLLTKARMYRFKSTCSSWKNISSNISLCRTASRCFWDSHMSSYSTDQCPTQIILEKQAEFRPLSLHEWSVIVATVLPIRMEMPFDCNGGYHSYLFVKMNEEYYTLSMLFACERHTVGRTNRYTYGSKNNNNNQTKREREKQCFLSSFCLRIG